MGILGKIFTWWDGATIGTSLFTAMRGEHIGTDGQGNKYFRQPVKDGAFERRWVIYNGANDASRVPAEWHGWLHHTFDELPESHLPPPRIWETEFTPNATGTRDAYLPAGSLERGGRTPRSSGDYESWTPDA